MIMKKNLLTVGFLAVNLSLVAQVVTHVDKGGIFYVGENALVYNGGGLQTKETGIFDIHGNMMVVGDGSAVFKTLDAANANQTLGGNIILRMNDLSTYNSYGQLYIAGLSQGNITAIVDKEYRAKKHGTYQQLALPFYQKQISSLSGTGIGTLGKTFTNARYSKNEVLTWTNITAVSDNLAVSSLTPAGTTYYMFGSANLDTGTPPAGMPSNPDPSDADFGTNATRSGKVYTLRGVPYTNGITKSLKDAAAGIAFGTNGFGKNSYNEYYNSYLQDDWDYVANPWAVNTYGRNIYQFGNPYLTNLDLGMIGYGEPGSITDGNAIGSIQGIRYDPGVVSSLPDGSTYSTSAKFVNFTTGVPNAVGDVGLIIKPMQTFVVKLRNNSAEVSGDKTLSFDNLRRFKYTPRASGTNYDVTNKTSGQSTGTVKQLGVIGLDANGVELARTYYVVYPDAKTGFTTQSTSQSKLGQDNILGTYEEDAVNGGYDMNNINSYWLYINEANETDFLGKAIPLALYNTSVKSFKFEIRENASLVDDGVHNLSAGIGFYFKTPGGQITELAQNQIIPISGDEFSLFYGSPNKVLGANGAAKPSRTRVVYNKAIEKYIVRFDPQWKKADVQVFDMSGKLIISQKDVKTNSDFEINLSKINQAYIVTAVSETGEKVSSKIVR